MCSTVGLQCFVGCSVPWGYHEYRGGYHEYRGGYHEYRGGYHKYHGGIISTGGVQYHGENLLLFEYPHGAEHPPRYS